MTTNYERIKSMSIEEMAEFLQKINCSQYDLFSSVLNCEICKYYAKCEADKTKELPYINWLQAEVEE